MYHWTDLVIKTQSFHPYLNSLNQIFSVSLEDVQLLPKRDLSSAVEIPVKVVLRVVSSDCVCTLCQRGGLDINPYHALYH